MKKSFLNAKSPFITEMVQVKTEELAKRKIKAAILDGATAVGIQLHCLDKEYRNEKTLKSIFDATGEVPVYVTNYRGGVNQGKTDNQLLEELLITLDCGATLVDIMGDAFDPSIEELTTNAVAIDKQMRFIEKVHEKGGEVLMSSHIHQFRNAERVLEIALEQQRRGADIVKIVTGANSEEEQLKNLEICSILKNNLKIPFLFLSTGTHVRLHRLIGPAFGVCCWLGFKEYDQSTYAGPPLLSEIIKIKEGLKL